MAKKNKDRPVSETTLNRFLDQIEKKYIGKNIFKRWISQFRFKRFCMETMKQSPSLGVLWFFADFIKLAERVYFYNNSKENCLYSSDNYAIGTNGFVINDKDNNLTIIVKLDADEQYTIIDIKRSSGKITEHKFVNNSWSDDRDNYDEVLIDNIIGIINSYMVALLKYCWNLKGKFDDINKKLTN